MKSTSWALCCARSAPILKLIATFKRQFDHVRKYSSVANVVKEPGEDVCCILLDFQVPSSWFKDIAY